MRGWISICLTAMACAVPFTSDPADSKVNYLDDTGETVDSDRPPTTPPDNGGGGDTVPEEDTDLWTDSTPDTDQVSSGGSSNPPTGGTTNPPGSGTTNPPGSGTTNPPGSGTTNPPGTGGTENCNDSIDDDGDGLVDCEDGDCANSSFCVETSCSDGVDDEGDGWVDCMDDDCWGNGCAVISSRITGGRWTQNWNSVMVARTVGGAPVPPDQDNERDLTLTALTGVLTLTDANGNTAEQCNFTIGNALAQEDLVISPTPMWTLDFQFNAIQLPSNCSLDYQRTVPENLFFPYPMNLQAGPYGAQWQGPRTSNYWTPPQRAFRSWIRLARTTSGNNTTTATGTGTNSTRTTFTRTSHAQGNILPGTSYTRPFP